MLAGGQPAAAGTAAPCIAAGVISLVAASVAGGLATFGATQGWTFEGVGASVGERAVFEPVVHNALGIAHYYDSETHKMLNQTYGDMLDSYNTKILAVTWVETLATANHTGELLENLNMTNGRIVTLNDNGIIRTALGQTDMMGPILESFRDFKSTDGTANPLLKKRQTLTVDWLSYNTYGENMQEGNQLLSGIEIDVNIVEEPSAFSFDTSFVQANSGGFSEKICVGVSPNGDSVGQDSVIVGEVYANQFGGIDTNCQSG